MPMTAMRVNDISANKVASEVSKKNLPHIPFCLLTDFSFSKLASLTSLLSSCETKSLLAKLGIRHKDIHNDSTLTETKTKWGKVGEGGGLSLGWGFQTMSRRRLLSRFIFRVAFLIWMAPQFSSARPFGPFIRLWCLPS